MRSKVSVLYDFSFVYKWAALDSSATPRQPVVRVR